MKEKWPDDRFEKVVSAGGLRGRRLVEGPLVVLSFEGTLASGDAGVAFQDLLVEAHVRPETRALAVDLRWVHYLPSKTVPWLVSAAARLAGRGGRLVVLTTGPTMERLVKVLGAPDAFAIAPDPERARFLLAEAMEG